MSALAMLCYQDPSLLQFQKRTQAPILGANLKNLWAIDSVPSDTQMSPSWMRSTQPSSEVSARSSSVYFRRGKHLEQYRVLGKYHLCAIDGSEYFSSDHIGCPSCLRRKVKKKREDALQFSHQIVQAAIVHPKLSPVIPLSAEAAEEHRRM